MLETLFKVTAFLTLAAIIFVCPAFSQAAGPAVCAPPSAVFKAVYNEEKLVFDMEAIGEHMMRVPSSFEHSRTTGYESVIENDCLKKIAVTINIFPKIHLPHVMRKVKDLTKGKADCHILAQVDRQRQFGRMTLAAYQAMGKEIEKLAIKAFPEKNVTADEEAAALMESAIAAAGLLANFDTAQEKRREDFRVKHNMPTTFDDCSTAGAKKSAKGSGGGTTRKRRR